MCSIINKNNNVTIYNFPTEIIPKSGSIEFTYGGKYDKKKYKIDDVIEYLLDIYWNTEEKNSLSFFENQIISESCRTEKKYIDLLKEKLSELNIKYTRPYRNGSTIDIIIEKKLAQIKLAYKTKNTEGFGLNLSRHKNTKKNLKKPYYENDFEFLIILLRNTDDEDELMGIYIIPMSMLIKHNCICTVDTEGKTCLSIYPPIKDYIKEKHATDWASKYWLSFDKVNKNDIKRILNKK